MTRVFGFSGRSGSGKNTSLGRLRQGQPAKALERAGTPANATDGAVDATRLCRALNSHTQNPRVISAFLGLPVDGVVGIGAEHHVAPA